MFCHIWSARQWSPSYLSSNRCSPMKYKNQGECDIVCSGNEMIPIILDCWSMFILSFEWLRKPDNKYLWRLQNFVCYSMWIKRKQLNTSQLITANFFKITWTVLQYIVLNSKMTRNKTHNYIGYVKDSTSTFLVWQDLIIR